MGGGRSIKSSSIGELLLKSNVKTSINITDIYTLNPINIPPDVLFKKGEINLKKLFKFKPVSIDTKDLFKNQEVRFNNVFSFKGKVNTDGLKFDPKMVDPNSIIGFNTNLKGLKIDLSGAKTTGINRLAQGIGESLNKSLRKVEFQIQGDKLLGAISNTTGINSRAGSGGIDINNPIIGSSRDVRSFG